MKNEEENIRESSEIDILGDLEDTDKAIIRLKIENPAITNIDIAKRLDLHRETIAKRLRKVKVSEAIAELNKSALNVLLETQSEAARKLRTIIRTSSDERAVIAACKEVLKGVLSENINLNLNRGHFQKWVESLSDEDVGELLGDD